MNKATIVYKWNIKINNQLILNKLYKYQSV